ncbi:MAG: DnaA regulatory inactivator Hda [Parahaliea sp.]
MASTPPPGSQLTLEVQLRDEATLANYLPLAERQLVVDALQALMAGEGESLIYLYGPVSSGKSHLLQAVCQYLGQNALYLPLAELIDCPPDAVLADIEQASLVCLDDIDAVSGLPNWELALFHCFNRIRAVGCRLLLSASVAPRQLTMELADLRSRLGWGLIFHLPDYDDAEKESLLVFCARRRGLVMSAEVARYLIARLPRNLEQLLAFLGEVDKLSLKYKRALTIPFLRQILAS